MIDLTALWKAQQPSGPALVGLIVADDVEDTDECRTRIHDALREIKIDHAPTMVIAGDSRANEIALRVAQSMRLTRRVVPDEQFVRRLTEHRLRKGYVCALVIADDLSTHDDILELISELTVAEISVLHV